MQAKAKTESDHPSFQLAVGDYHTPRGVGGMKVLEGVGGKGRLLTIASKTPNRKAGGDSPILYMVQTGNG